jgi:hypothetical protein
MMMMMMMSKMHMAADMLPATDTIVCWTIATNTPLPPLLHWKLEPGTMYHPSKTHNLLIHSYKCQHLATSKHPPQLHRLMQSGVTKDRRDESLPANWAT